MSNVTLAASAGFCFGVKRAIEMAYAEIEKNNGAPLYSYGPLIHNKEVTRDLDEKGLHIIEDLEGVHEGTVVIRSHGVGKFLYDALEEKGILGGLPLTGDKKGQILWCVTEMNTKEEIDTLVETLKEVAGK